MQLEAGITIRNYTLDEQVGQGAIGEVWKAHGPAKVAAMKFMHQHLLDNKVARQHLENEIRTLGQLRSPHIPALYNADLRFERPYLIMEYVDGPSYEQLLTTDEIIRVDIRTRLQCLAALARTISTAHQTGIVHRDIKPGNIKGIEKPYLLDFSVALHLEETRDLRQDVGTAIYMSPEGPADKLSDNYSFAVVAYEILFGKHPIFAVRNIEKDVTETRQIARERLKKGQWGLPSRLQSEDLPSDLWGADLEYLDHIFARALGDRHSRYTDLIEFVNQLKQGILTLRNRTFIDAEAPPPSSMPLENSQPIVVIEPIETNHGLDNRGFKLGLPKQERGMMVGLLVVFTFWFVVVLMLVFLSRPV